MDYIRPDNDYTDYTSEPCDWLLLPGVRPEVINARTVDYSMAVHEAGHAVLSENFEYRVISVAIQGVVRGLTETESTKKNPEHVIMIAHAGYVAQIQVVCKRYAFSAANDDNLLIHRVREEQKYSLKHLRELYQRCLDAVEQNWTQIQEVAKVLATKKTLTGEELRDIIQKTKTTAELSDV